MASRYWCYTCRQVVDPIMEVEIMCPFCQRGFVEEMSSSNSNNSPNSDGGRNADLSDSDFGSDRALSLWAPILLGMMGNPRRRRRFRRLEFDDYDDHDIVGDGENEDHVGETELDRELESIIRRRRRSSATILQLLQGIRAGLASETQNSESFRDRDRDRERDERERVILINPFNQTVLVQGQNVNQNPIGSLGDYFIGPGLDMLLQHLAENDPNRYGTPPAQKAAVEALPTVAIKETLQCSVCLDDFEVSAEAKEMPCKHKFHSDCILPWLDLHSSCPVCRFQLPSDESKRDSDGSRSGNAQRAMNAMSSENVSPVNGGDEGDGDGRNGSGRRFSFLWPFSGLFSSSGSSHSSGGNSSSSSSNATGTNGSGSSSSQANEN